jgi:glycosyltransferase involved in cell wall biosynthesis
MVLDLEEFSQAIAHVKYEEFATKRLLVETARRYVQEKFDWQAIAHNFYRFLISTT